jgi:hypothetical protein
MFRPASRALLRAPAPSAAFRPAPRRLLSTSAEGKSRSWKNTAVRLGLAIGAVYYYNTSSVFAEHSLCMLPSREPAARFPLLTQKIQSPANNPPNLPTPLPPQPSTPSSPGSATSEPNRSLPANMPTRSSPSPRPSASRQTQGL